MPTNTVEKTKKKEISKAKKSELLLDSLEIIGYRCFEHLTIEKLSRVNLIVGKNNVGKTALLEALWLWADGYSWLQTLSVIKKILERRNEKNKNEDRYSNIPELRTPKKKGQTSFMSLFEQSTGEEFRHLYFGRPKETISDFKISNRKYLKKQILQEWETAADRKEDFVGVQISPLTDGYDVKSLNVIHRTDFHNKIETLFVGSEGITKDILLQIWDEIILNAQEDYAFEALRIISPQIIDLNFINYPKTSQFRVPVVRIKDIKERVPLSSLGEGMNRLLGIALALIQCRNGILLMDEIEIGLHYSVLPDVWKLIFKTAKDLNVQVFATTHSKDCVEAFAAAAEESPEDGMLIRLERHGEKIVAKTIEEERLVDAVNYDVEVR